ncbi:MAG: leucine-rich repeat domain-containing protein [Promethearchaeota archaeon]
MKLTPNKIFELFERKDIDKYSAYNYLISFIENSENENIIIDSLENLDKIGLYDDKLFIILERTIVSDSNSQIRNIAIKYLNIWFLNKAIRPLEWAIKHESDYYCLINIIKTLKKVNNQESKLILFKEVKRITKLKYINKEKKIDNKRFKRVIKKLIKIKKFDLLSNKELAEIYINFLTIKELTKRYPNAFYEVDCQNGLVKELDLSDFLEFEVKGTPWGWKNDIKSLSEIMGLTCLKNLKKIDLSNNHIKNIKELVGLKKLTHLILTNNRISELENIEYINKMPSIKFLDLRYNEIAKKVTHNDFNKNIRVLLSDYLIIK